MFVIKKYLLLVFVLFLSYWAIKPFFIPGFFPIHDDAQVARVFEMKKALLDGMFPVRWVPDLGYNYGYPIFNFYAPLAYYVGGFFNLIGFDALVATKIMMVIGILVAGIFMYLLAKEFWGEVGGFVAGLLYLYAPYHAVDIYVRGDVAEFYAYACIPLVFYALWKVYKKREWKYVVIGSIAYGAIILSHNLTAMMVTPFLFILTMIFYIKSRTYKKPHKPYFIPLILLIGILLASFYWLPTLLEMRYTNVISQIGGGSDYRDHFVCLNQLWNSPWGFGGSAPGCIDGFSLKIGKLHILFALFSLISLPFLRKLNKDKFTFVMFFVVSLFVSVALMLNVSGFIWSSIPLMSFFQFPWRFLILSSFFTSFLAGGLFWILQKKLTHKFLSVSYSGMIIISLFFIIYFNSGVFTPQTVLKKNAADYTSKYALTWVVSRISDEYMPKGFHKPKNANEIPNKKIAGDSKIKILSLSEKTQNIQAKVDASEGTIMRVNIAHFPAWHATVDNREAPLKYDSSSLLVQVPRGSHTLNVTYSQTPIEKTGDLLALAGVAILIIGIITHREELFNA